VLANGRVLSSKDACWKLSTVPAGASLAIKACEFLSWKSIYNPKPTAPTERSMIALSTKLDI
jgi:hypothetical protein